MVKDDRIYASLNSYSSVRIVFLFSQDFLVSIFYQIFLLVFSFSFLILALVSCKFSVCCINPFYTLMQLQRHGRYFPFVNYFLVWLLYYCCVFFRFLQIHFISRISAQNVAWKLEHKTAFFYCSQNQVITHRKAK